MKATSTHMFMLYSKNILHDYGNIYRHNCNNNLSLKKHAKEFFKMCTGCKKSSFFSIDVSKNKQGTSGNPCIEARDFNTHEKA